MSKLALAALIAAALIPTYSCDQIPGGDVSIGVVAPTPSPEPLPASGPAPAPKRDLGPPAADVSSEAALLREAANQRDRMPPAYFGPPVQLEPGTEAALLSTSRWQFIGPRNFGYGGRVNGVAYAPSNTAIRYAASCEGGVWKTTDSGGHWTPTMDSQFSLETTSVAVDPTDPNIVLAGTGDFDSGWKRYAMGVLRSTDGGAHWVQTDMAANDVAVSAIVIDPDDPSVVVAATGRGVSEEGAVWRSTDGGITWGTTNAFWGMWSDLEIGRPDWNGVRHYYLVGHQAGGVIWRSDDRGGTWQQLTSPRGDHDWGTRVPVEVGASHLDPNTVYMLFAPGPNALGNMEGWAVYVSYDAGNTWSPLPNMTISGATFDLGNQQAYDITLGVGGTQQDVVYAGGQNALAYLYSAQVWQSFDYGHADQHGIDVNPSKPDSVMMGDDGGVYVVDHNPTTATWGAASNKNATLGLQQFYSIGTHPGDLNQVVGGMQDNGTGISQGNLNAWSYKIGGDGGFSAFDPTSPNIVYATVNTFLFRSSDGGTTYPDEIGAPGSPSSFPGATALDPSKSSRVYGAGNHLYLLNKTTLKWDQVGSGAVVLDPTNPNSFASATAVAKSDSNVIYVGADDGSVTLVRNALGIPSFTIITNNLPDRDTRPIAAVSVNQTNPYDLLIGGDRIGTGGAGGLWRCPDTRNPSWTQIAGTGNTALPLVGIFAVVRDPLDPSHVWYVATEVGVFQTTDGGATWSNATAPLGLPNVMARALDLNPTTRYLTVGTFGRGAWRIPMSGGSLPDLAVTGSSLSPSAPRAGNLVTFSATIKNQGAAATSANVVHSISFSVDGTVRSTSSNNTSSLAIGASRTQAGAPTWKATAGTHTLLVRADDVNSLSESNEQNNTRTVTFTVAP